MSLALSIQPTPVISGPFAPATTEGSPVQRRMHRRDVSIYVGDTGDALPALDAEAPAPLHGVGPVRLGMRLIDAANVEELAAVCEELSATASLLTVAAPRIHGLTGVPVNPLAIL